MTSLVVTDAEDRRLIWWAVAVTMLIHVVLAIAFSTASSLQDGDSTSLPIERKLCDGIRCPEKPRLSVRRDLDESNDLADMSTIEAAVVPMLGYAEAKTGYFPKLLKYEQPERIEEAVNLSRDNPDNLPVPDQDIAARKAEIDKQRKGRLAAILGAPEDDDPRKRPTALERIVGSRDGSVYGNGADSKSGNVYAGKVALAIRQQFTVPPFVSQAELGNLRVRIRVSRMDAAGHVLEFEILEKCANPGFNAAAVQAIKQFVPKEGGRAALPVPDGQTLSYINSRGMMIDLDGALFRR